jgi:ADP-ribosylglycohydrolase
MEDNIKGLIFGQAIGDALGLTTEFMTKEDVMSCYPNGINGYQDIVSDRHRSRWEKGE